MRPHRLLARLAGLSGLGDLADLVWPLACGGCGVDGVRWCQDCARLLAGPARPTSPDPRPAQLPPVWTLATYDGPVRRAIVSWKDEGRHDLSRVLAPALSASVLAAMSARSTWATGPIWPTEDLWLVPMPSRPAARRQRGGDALRGLAVRAAAELRRSGRPVRVLPVLRHVRGVIDQAGLDAVARAANVAGAFAARDTRLLAGATCLLVDDVVTTGATLAEAASVIRAAGGHPIGAAVIAATQRRRGVRLGSE